MKTTLIALLAVSATFLVRAQEIPNAGLEEWTTADGVTNPEMWNTSNMPGGLALVSPSETAFSGDFSAHLQGYEVIENIPNYPVMNTGVAASELPESMLFQVSGTINEFDTLYALSIAFDASLNAIGGGIGIFTAQDFDGWQEIEVPIMPIFSGDVAGVDVTFFLLTAGENTTSSVLIDEVSLSGATVGVSEQANDEFVQTWFVNNDMLHIDLDAAQSPTVHVDLIDMRGNIVRSEVYPASGNATRCLLPMSGLAHGLYVARIETAGRQTTIKIAR